MAIKTYYGFDYHKKLCHLIGQVVNYRKRAPLMSITHNLWVISWASERIKVIPEWKISKWNRFQSTEFYHEWYLGYQWLYRSLEYELHTGGIQMNFDPFKLSSNQIEAWPIIKRIQGTTLKPNLRKLSKVSLSRLKITQEMPIYLSF